MADEVLVVDKCEDHTDEGADDGQDDEEPCRFVAGQLIEQAVANERDEEMEEFAVAPEGVAGLKSGSKLGSRLTATVQLCWLSS